MKMGMAWRGCLTVAGLALLCEPTAARTHTATRKSRLMSRTQAADPQWPANAEVPLPSKDGSLGPGLDPEPFSPEKVENALTNLECMCDAASKYPNVFSLLSKGKQLQRSSTAMTSTAHTHRRMGIHAKTGNPCACDAFASRDPGPTNEIDGVVYYVSQCQVGGKDLDFWRLRNTDYRPGGIILKSTVAYANSCDECSAHNLKCDAKPTTVFTGYCMCMWRVDGADSKLKLVPCGRCVPDCIGKYVNFDIGQFMQPVQQNGLCIKKKGYFR